MTLYGLALAILGAVSLVCTIHLHLMRKAAHRTVEELERLRREASENVARTLQARAYAEQLLVDAQNVYDAAKEYSREAVRRWLDVVSGETRVH